MTHRLQVSVSEEVFSWLTKRAQAGSSSLSGEAAKMLEFAKASLEAETPFSNLPVADVAHSLMPVDELSEMRSAIDAGVGLPQQVELKPASHRQVMLGKVP